MNQHNQRGIREYLRQGEVQARIWKHIRDARERATVTISRAAQLSGFSESQLRDWEKRGLLQTERPVSTPEKRGSTGPGHRQYSPAELEKLAVMWELIEHGGYAASEIASDVDKVWSEVAAEYGPTEPDSSGTYQEAYASKHEEEQLSINERAKRTEEREFWRYFVSQSLRISLELICEDIPETVAGLVLPLEDRKLARQFDIHPFDSGRINSEHLSRVGLSLIGWLSKDRSFHSFLADTPRFEFPSDFRLLTLRSVRREWVSISEEPSAAEQVLDNVFIVVQREAKLSLLSQALVETVQRVLKLVYAHVSEWKRSFDYGRHDWFYQAHDMAGISVAQEYTIFTRLIDRVIELGGLTPEGKNRWSFALLYVPRDPGLPVQQQSLVVRTQTKDSPYMPGVTTIESTRIENLGLKAFLSGHLCSLARILPNEYMRIYHSSIYALEESTRSAIALPLVNGDGVSMGAFYVASNIFDAFPVEDQRVLRVIGRMFEELLLTANMRRQVVGRLADFIAVPSMVDATFRGFDSETDFVVALDALLQKVGDNRMEGSEEKECSLMSVDIDGHSLIAARYGNRVARDLSQQVGRRIQEELRLGERFAASRLFHVGADKYYLLLEGVSLRSARRLAWQLKDLLNGEYLLEPAYTAPGRPILRETMLEIPRVSVHLGISSYPLEKFESLLRRYNQYAVINTRNLLMVNIELIAARGHNEGGDCITSWSHILQKYITLKDRADLQTEEYPESQAG